jgi:transcriptional regulator with XRE-family HTH domain
MQQESMSTYLRERRKALGISQNELGERVAATGPAVHRWEHADRVPHRRYHAALEEILGAPITVLLAPVNDNDPR